MNIPSRWAEALAFLITGLLLAVLLDDANAAVSSQESAREFLIGDQKEQPS